MKKYFLIAAIQLLSLLIYAQTNTTVSTVKLVNVNDEETEIPSLGKKVVIIFYVDPDVQKLTDPLSDALEEKKFPLDKFAVIGIADCRDTWIPNPIIRSRAKRQQEKFPQSLILLDNNHSLKKAWDLGDCNNKLTVLIIGKDREVKYRKALETIDESRAIIPGFIETVQSEINKLAVSGKEK